MAYRNLQIYHDQERIHIMCLTHILIYIIAKQYFVNKNAEDDIQSGVPLKRTTDFNEPKPHLIQLNTKMAASSQTCKFS